MCTESKGLDIVKYLWYNKGLMDKYRPTKEALTVLGKQTKLNEGNQNVRS